MSSSPWNCLLSFLKYIWHEIQIFPAELANVRNGRGRIRRPLVATNTWEPSLSLAAITNPKVVGILPRKHLADLYKFSQNSPFSPFFPGGRWGGGGRTLLVEYLSIYEDLHIRACRKKLLLSYLWLTDIKIQNFNLSFWSTSLILNLNLFSLGFFFVSLQFIMASWLGPPDWIFNISACQRHLVAN